MAPLIQFSHQNCHRSNSWFHSQSKALFSIADSKFLLLIFALQLPLIFSINTAPDKILILNSLKAMVTPNGGFRIPLLIGAGAATHFSSPLSHFFQVSGYQNVFSTQFSTPIWTALSWPKAAFGQLSTVQIGVEFYVIFFVTMALPPRLASHLINNSPHLSCQVHESSTG